MTVVRRQGTVPAATEVSMRPVLACIRSSLRRRLTLLMAALIVVPALVSGLLLTAGARALLRREASSHMEALAAAKAADIEAAALRWLADEDLFTRRVAFRTEVHRLVSAPRTAEASREELVTSLRGKLEDLARPHGAQLGDAVVVALDSGRAVAWAGPGSLQAAQAHAATYNRAALAAHLTPWLSSIYPDAKTGRPMLDVVQVIPPPENTAGKGVAALIWQIPLDRDVAPCLEQREGMGETGEMVLVDSSGLVLKELRYERGAVMKKTLHADPVLYALAGKTGTEPLRDYRGRPVLAAYRGIPATGWGLVVKKDLAEAEAGVTRLSWLWAISTALVALVGVLVAGRTASRVARPVVDLSGAARRMAGGDLTARVAATRTDELGQLAADFNRMADELARHRGLLEDEIEERTTELHLSGEQLRQAVTEREQAEATLLGYQEELRSLATQASVAEERAREEVAADLHDTVLQQLALAKLRLGQLKAAVASTDDSSGLAEMERLVQEGINSGRALLRSLSPAGLQEQGLEHALGMLCDRVRNRHGLAVVYEHDPEPVPLPQDLRVLLFQAVRELLMNVVKHAQARQATISLQRSDHSLRLAVADDGVGFDLDQDTAGDAAEGGFGLRSIRERLRHLGGSLQVDSAPGKGTRVTAVVPVASD